MLSSNLGDNRTLAIPVAHGTLEIDFDLVAHRLVVRTAETLDGGFAVEQRQQVLVEAPPVDADPDRFPLVDGDSADRRELLVAPDAAGRIIDDASEVISGRRVLAGRCTRRARRPAPAQRLSEAQRA